MVRFGPGCYEGCYEVADAAARGWFQYSDAKLRCRLPVLWLMKEASAQYRKPFKQHLAVTEKLLNLVKEVMVLGQRSN
jgi:hypothetical protein